MKNSILSLWLGLALSSRCVAQFGGDDLTQTAWTLSINRHTGDFFMGLAGKRQMARFDTMATTGRNSSEKEFYYMMQQDYEKGVFFL
ncbi:MAG: hypothetical protein LH609_19290, partial [Rudanella sp.]|nr:hypothetical protein [Rudanella sp.]